jgi:glycerol-3-phosphate acyltransferase PlsY
LLCDAAKARWPFCSRALFPGRCDSRGVRGPRRVLGHLFPLWLGFQAAAKGVATFLGVTLALDWPVGLLALATWLVAALIWRMSSLSALIAAVLTPLYMALFHHPLFAMLELVLVLLIFAMHRENIRRILSGREPKIDGAAEAATASAHKAGRA